LSPRELKKCYDRFGTSIQDFKHIEPKRRGKTWVSLSIDLFAIAIVGIVGLETKHQTSIRGSTYILLDRWGLRAREKNETTLSRPTHHGTDEGWKKERRSYNLQQLIMLHNLSASESA